MESFDWIIKILEYIKSYPFLIYFVILVLIPCFFVIKLLSIYPNLFSFFNKNRKIKLNDTKLTRYDNEYNDIYAFNCKYKVNAITMVQIKDYIFWLKNKGISPYQIKTIKNYFNVQTLKITRVKTKYTNYLIILGTIFYGVFCFLLLIVNSNSVFFITDEKEPIVWLSKQEASIYTPSWLPISHTDWKLASNECPNLNIDSQKYKLLRSKLALISIKDICDTFNNASFDNNFDNLLSKFQKLLLLYSTIPLFFCIFSWKFASKRILTRNIREQIIINNGKKVLLFKLRHSLKKS